MKSKKTFIVFIILIFSFIFVCCTNCNKKSENKCKETVGCTKEADCQKNQECIANICQTIDLRRCIKNSDCSDDEACFDYYPLNNKYCSKISRDKNQDTCADCGCPDTHACVYFKKISICLEKTEIESRKQTDPYMHCSTNTEKNHYFCRYENGFPFGPSEFKKCSKDEDCNPENPWTNKCVSLRNEWGKIESKACRIDVTNFRCENDSQCPEGDGFND